MSYSNLYFLEHEVKARLEELRLEAQAHRSVRLARSQQEGWLSTRLRDLRCHLLDLMVGLGFALERCTVPLRPVSQ